MNSRNVADKLIKIGAVIGVSTIFLTPFDFPRLEGGILVFGIILVGIGFTILARKDHIGN